MMIGLACHTYFDVPSKDHMLCPWREKGCKLLTGKAAMFL